MWRPRLSRVLSGLDGFGGVRSRNTPRLTLARFPRVFGEHESRSPGRAVTLARATTELSCPNLALRFAVSGGSVLRSAACLASLHHRPPRGSRSPAMTLMRFVSHVALGPTCVPHTPGTDRTVVPSELERGSSTDPPCRSLRTGCACDCLSKLSPPAGLGFGFPVPTLLWFALDGVHSPSARPLQGFVPRLSESLEGLEIPTRLLS